MSIARSSGKNSGVQTVSPTPESLDVGPTIGHRAKRLSQDVHVLCEVGFFYNGVRPNALHEFFRTDDLLTSSCEHGKRSDGLRSQRQLHAILQQESRPDVKLKIPEFVNLGRLRPGVKVNFRFF
jgi:hypothetical protein